MKDNLEMIISDLETTFDSFNQMEDAYYDFMPLAKVLVSKLEALPNPKKSLPFIFKLIEDKSEDIEYGLGAPGHIGHFLESFYLKGYEKYLLDSLNRKPTSYCVFLLQRIIVDPKNPNKSDYISLLEKISINKQISKELHEDIMSTLSDFK